MKNNPNSEDIAIQIAENYMKSIIMKVRIESENDAIKIALHSAMLIMANTINIFFDESSADKILDFIFVDIKNNLKDRKIISVFKIND